MPIYEFRCNDCGYKFETLVMKKDQKVNCEKCGSENLSRLLSSFAVLGNEKSSGSAESNSRCSSCSTRKCATCNL